MERRSTRHRVEEISTKPNPSRSKKNRVLYNEVNDRISYEEIEDIKDYDNVGTHKKDHIRTREEYQRNKELNLDFNQQKPENKQTKEEEKVYDINTVLESAKKNRSITDDADQRRKLQDREYNIVTDLTQKYLEKKEKMDNDLEKEGIRELIDTITSNTLIEDVKKADEDNETDLMSDLMATSTLTSISNVALQEELAKEILIEEQKKEEEKQEDLTLTKEDGKIINSFYTRSMDLSEQDFEIRDEILEENRAKRKIMILVVLIVLIIIAIASVIILNKLEII